jgi:hypothetical protein
VSEPTVDPMPSLATASDLAALGFPVTNTGLVAALLASVSAQVREAAGVPITAMTSTIIVAGTREQFLTLPGGPVRAVTNVKLDGVQVTDFKLRDNRIWRATGWKDQSSDVTVTYTHGLDEAPKDIVHLVCSFVGAGLLQAEDDGSVVRERGITSMRIDDAQWSYARGDDEIVDVTELPQRVKDSLRARFTGSAAVIGTY